jgi:hypothetical protein
MLVFFFGTRNREQEQLKEQHKIYLEKIKQAIKEIKKRCADAGI